MSAIRKTAECDKWKVQVQSRHVAL